MTGGNITLEQAGALFAGLHALLEDPGLVGEEEYGVVVDVLARAAADASSKHGEGFYRTAAEMTAIDCTDPFDGPFDEAAHLFAALTGILRDPELRRRYSLAVRLLTNAAFEMEKEGPDRFGRTMSELSAWLSSWT